MTVAVSILCFFLCAIASHAKYQKAIRGHPRIMANQEDFDNVAKLVKSNSVARTYLDGITKDGTKILSERPVSDPRDHNPSAHLLGPARTAKGRMYHMGLLYQLTKDMKWAERGILEMVAISKFKDWNPSHFLDTAEFSHAFAIGIDWLYPTLNESVKSTIFSAAVKHGLDAIIAAYEARPQPKWVYYQYNWNCVCNGGVLSLALALQDEHGVDQSAIRSVVGNATHYLPNSFAGYSSDGGWTEGPNYWQYATEYAIVASRSLITAYGSDGGLSKATGFNTTGFFGVYSKSPTNLTFNWGDAPSNGAQAYDLMYLGKTYGSDAVAFQARDLVTSSPRVWDLIFLDLRGSMTDLEKLPKAKLFKDKNVGFFRTSWDGVAHHDATFVGFKGGNNTWNHDHLDFGSFVFDTFGERLAIDLGADSYSLHGYFGHQRWTYYRCKNEGHNTLSFGKTNENQVVNTVSKVTAFQTSDHCSWAVVDMTEAYTPFARSVKRGFLLLNGDGSSSKPPQLIIQDEIASAKNNIVNWRMHANLHVSCKGRSCDVGSSKVELMYPTSSTEFEVVSAKPPAPQNPNDGVVVIQASVDPTKISKLTVGLGRNIWLGDSSEIAKLSDWGSHRPAAVC